MPKLKQLLTEDARFWMPPQPGTWVGRDTVTQVWIDGGFGSETFGSVRCLVTWANRQPAVAYYARVPGDEAYRPMALDVLRIEEGAIAEIVVFDGSHFAMFDLPQRLDR